MPGGHGGGPGVPLDRQAPFDLVFTSACFVALPVGWLVLSFAVAPVAPPWVVWIARAVTVAVLVAAWRFVVRARVRELRRRNDLTRGRPAAGP